MSELTLSRAGRALLLVAALAGHALAATPEEQAAFRDEARRLTEEGRSLHERADTAYLQAQQIFISEFRKGIGLDDQATERFALAYQRWLQGAARNVAKAALLRETARSLQLAAYQSEVLAQLADDLAGTERLRATQLRENADALLATGSDPETVAIVRDLDRQADKNDRDAQGYENQAAQHRDQAERAGGRAAVLIEKAVKLEGAP